MKPETLAIGKIEKKWKFQGSTNCAILSSQMGEQRVSWENMEITKNMGYMENINRMTENTLFVIKNIPWTIQVECNL